MRDCSAASAAGRFGWGPCWLDVVRGAGQDKAAAPIPTAFWEPNSMNHIMIDLETMGTLFNAPVLAIGACYFDADTGEIGDRFYGAIDIADACRFGRPSGDTIRWWMGQNDDARKAAIAGTKPAAEVFEAFEKFLLRNRNACPWGNGATFDISILEYAFLKVLNRSAPWKFWNVRDCRTVKALAAGLPNYPGERQGTHHQAMDDAVFQAQWVSHYWMTLRGKTPKPVAETVVPLALAAPAAAEEVDLLA